MYLKKRIYYRMLHRMNRFIPHIILGVIAFLLFAIGWIAFAILNAVFTVPTDWVMRYAIVCPGNANQINNLHPIAFTIDSAFACAGFGN